MASYSNRLPRPIGCNDQAMGGAAMNLGIEALTGETDMVTVFDDFNGTLKGAEGFGDAAVWEDSGWVLTDVNTPAADAISMNSPSTVAIWAPSCISIYPGTTDDAGGNMQLDLINGTIGTMVGTPDFPHICIPETAAGVTAIDNTSFVFACRLGVRADFTTTGSGAWTTATPGGKFFIGWSVAGEAAIMTAATGVLAVAAAADQLVGFHIGEDGSLDGVSQRVGTTAYVEGTNFTEILPAGGVAGTVANGATTAGDTMWFDLALRMDVLDWSETTGNGFTTFYHRRVPALSGIPGNEMMDRSGIGSGNWQKHATVLTDQVPVHTVGLCPSIEAINGPTAGTDCVFLLDWWAFGTSRFSRFSR